MDINTSCIKEGRCIISGHLDRKKKAKSEHAGMISASVS